MTDAESANQKIAVEGMSKVTKLLSCPEFGWFMRECVISKMTELDAVIHDKNKSVEERNSALDAWHSLKEAREWPDRTRNMFGAILGHKPSEPHNFSE